MMILHFSKDEDMDKILWRNNIKEAAQDIGSKEFQELAWFGKSDQISSPVEVYCMLFDDFLFDDFLESSDIGLSDEQKYLGNKLRDSLNTYSPPGSTLPPPEQMLDDPEWQKVRNIAREFVDSLEQPGT